MPCCFFCRSKYHISLNCDIHVSDAERKRATQLKLHCSRCLKRLGFAHFFTNTCKTNRKCYICFSKKHHTFFCPERFEIPRFFLPNIDAALIPYFFKILHPFEQYLISCSAPKFINLHNFKSLKIVKEISNIDEDKDDAANSIIVVNCVLNFRNSNWSDATIERTQNFLQKVLHENIIIKARTVELSNTQLRSHELFYFLTFNTKILYCNEMTIVPKVKFDEILKRIPNIEEIKFSDTEIEIDKDWPEVLLKWENKSYIKRMQLYLDDIDFDVAKLAEFMKTKCVKDVVIYLYISFSNQHLNYENFKEDIINHITEKHFVPVKSLKAQRELFVYTVKDNDDPNQRYNRTDLLAKLVLKK